MPDELDDILDCSLAQYSNAEPLTGLEDRILQRIRTEAVVRGGANRIVWAAVAVLCTAALFVLAMAIHLNRKTNPEQARVANDGKTATRAAAAASERPVLLAGRLAGSNERRKIRRAVRTLPKQMDFPARTGMTAEEKALVRFVSSSQPGSLSPTAKDDSVTADAQIEPAPIVVDAIEITLLANQDSSKKDGRNKGAE